MSRFYCFINDKIKKEPENVELHINVAKMGNSTFFRDKQQIPWQTVNSMAWRENPRAAKYCWLWKVLENQFGPGKSWK